MSEQKAPLNKLNTLILTATPLLAITAVPYYGFQFGYDLFEWSTFMLFMGLTGVSITAGYHRLWTHKSYDAHFSYRLFWSIWGACSLQNSILHWASDHRNHHRFVDKDERDPYSAKRGFWFSHIGWILRKYPSGVDDHSNVKDLMEDPVVMWQHRNYLFLAVSTNLFLPLMIGYWHGDIWGSLLLAGLLRLVLNHHFTFLINSLAHIWGDQEYDADNTARDSHFLAFFTYGEGYHNYHHRFQWDYRNGIRWWHFDPAKWLVKVCSWVGLCYGLKKPSKFKIEQAHLRVEYNRAVAETQPSIRERLEGSYLKLSSALEDLASLQKQVLESGSTEATSQFDRAEIGQRYEELKSNLGSLRQEWHSLRSEVAA